MSDVADTRHAEFWKNVRRLSEDPIQIYTDLEPDDVYAIWILLMTGHKIHTIVVGEGRTLDSKVKRMNRYLELAKTFGLDVSGIRVCAGMSSSINAGFTKSEFTDIDTTDKKSDAPVAPDESKADSFDHDAFRKSFLEYVTSTKKPVLVVLKPLRELLMLWHDATFDRALLAKADLYLYGSFNLRCVLRQEAIYAHTQFLQEPAYVGWSTTQRDELASVRGRAEVVSLIEAFGSATVFESFFAFGQNNNVSEAQPDGRKLYERFLPCVEATGDSYKAALLRFTGLWNMYLATDCAADCCALIGVTPADSSWQKMVKRAETSGYFEEQLPSDAGDLIDKHMLATDQAVVRQLQPGMAQIIVTNPAKREADVAKFIRNFKAFQQIMRVKNFQMVLADQAFMACATHPVFDSFIKHGYMSINTLGYTVMDVPIPGDSATHKRVRYYHNVNREQVINCLCSFV